MDFDVIIIGGGHAGIEAANAVSKMGKKVLLLTTLIEQIGAASCNPAIGGLAKGHLVKELDALGGLMGEITDAAGIGFRTLNESKGAAVRGSRAQIDMDAYKIEARKRLFGLKNLEIVQELASELLCENGVVKGVRTRLKNTYFSKIIILTVGTFLDGILHVGENVLKGGRIGEPSSTNLAQSLRKMGLKTARLKTGTPPRLVGESIDFSVLDVQAPCKYPKPFSFRTKNFAPFQLPCFIARTNEKTHDIIRANLSRAPLFSGQIKGVGPRYCPSIEDKITRFADKNAHHLFVEPQTKDALEYYINGLSTSLPADVQREMIRSIKGFEKAVISRYGYAVEYDFFDPTQLRHDLSLKGFEGLFLAGQINGTTGYEEAAVQGLMAGINAVLYLEGKESFVLRRDEAYIGVLIDDLVTKGTNEPYRMFTSRAEYRLLLREENAVIRLSEYGRGFGLLSNKDADFVKARKEEIEKGVKTLLERTLNPTKENNAFLAKLGEEKISTPCNLQKIVARSSFNVDKLRQMDASFEGLCEYTLSEIINEAKYYHYIKMQEDKIAKMKEGLSIKIPKDFDFSKIGGLSNEVVEKLNTFNPPNLEAAARISGVTPAAVDIIQIYLKYKISNF